MEGRLEAEFDMNLSISKVDSFELKVDTLLAA